MKVTHNYYYNYYYNKINSVYIKVLICLNYVKINK